MSRESKDGYGALLEDVASKFSAIMESQAAMANVPTRLSLIENHLASIDSTLSTMQLVLSNHEQRLRRIEP